MPLTLRLEKENGEAVDSVVDDKNTLLSISQRVDISTTYCIRFIDPFGNTVFNYLQSEVLIKELENLGDHAVTKDEYSLIGKIMTLAKDCQTEPHLYIKIYGD